MSAPERIECPNCRQSIKRPALPPGAKCLCPKCSQPFTIEGGEPTKQAPPPTPVPAKPPAPSPPVKSSPPVETRPATPAQPVLAAASPAVAAAKPPATSEPASKPIRESAIAPRPDEFRLHCFLCGSLLYARVDQIGGTITCHDCHSENEVRPPKPQDMQKASDGPRLDDAEDFRLSETFERPKFSSLEIPPTEEPDDDDSEIKPLVVTPTEEVNSTSSKSSPRADAGMVELFSSHGGVQPSAAPAPRNTPAQTSPPPPPPRPHSAANPAASTSAATTAAQPFSPEQLGNKFKASVAALFPPASETASQPGKPRIRTHADSYGDELWSGATDPTRPAFERSPFLVGIVEFLFYPGTMPRWLALVALACIPTAVLQMTSGAVGEYGTLFSGSALGLLFFATIVGVPWMLVFGAHAMSIVSDTGRGCDAIEHWPLGGFVPRGNPLFLPISFLAGMLPGLFVFAIYYLSRESPSIRGPMMMLVSAMFFTPLLWLPMLLEKSPLAPFHSQTFWQSFRHSGDGWFLFYFATFMLALLAAGGVALWASSPILAPLSAALVVTPLFLYLRLLGRMLWYIDPDMAPPPPPSTAVAPPPLPDTVDPTQYRRP